MEDTAQDWFMLEICNYAAVEPPPPSSGFRITDTLDDRITDSGSRRVTD